MSEVSSARILGLAGLISGVLSVIGGFSRVVPLIGVASAVMLVANAFVLVRRGS